MMAGALAVNVTIDDLVAHLATSIQSIERLRLGPGDVLVVTLRGTGIAEDLESVRSFIAAVLKRSGLHNSLIVVGESITFSVVTPASEGGA